MDAMMPTKHPSPADHEQWQRQLREGLAELGLALSPAQQKRLLDYLALLEKWNRAFNLTAVRDPQRMVSRQLLDSLSILPWVRGPRVLDVGTGAGLPGIPLAIALPEYRFVLLDSNGKKVRFVRQAIMQLDLDNVSVRQQRVEAMSDPDGFDIILSRAFADLEEMLALTAHLRAPAGIWAAMKSGLAELEPRIIPAGMGYRVERLKVPAEQGERNLVLIGPQDALAHGQPA